MSHEVGSPAAIYNKGKQPSKKSSSTDSPISIMNIFRTWLLENHCKEHVRFIDNTVKQDFLRPL